ncbi:MAG: hypothetical protein COT24_01615 [Candidatus Kerfeldbacteria bacterium CG08_land_8_20_14_0_20_40_16]|uniref:Uncharacterized protein n=1 Tax=Candidatus Kerfeldbacteria bacterium CG08_land_8_20_14_0_20_40_16 TaxID=2014244 RepID=A0A2H0YWZ5_9BACT|nr:MAG: hypothetical protein COT24_01615 [Candidatus Kerfeldbacteria bacterium CG08_land_8_20_14_0_20_40_16]
MPIPQLSKRYQQTWKKHAIGTTPSGKKKRPQKTIVLLLKIVVALFIIGGILGVSAFAWFSKDLPDPNRILERNIAQSTKIYDRSGNTLLYEIHGEQKRTLVTLDQIPDYLQKATVVIEDKDFYKHGGISLWAIFRTAITNVFLGRKAGGSTLTQQLVKNAILTPEKTYTRKIKEAILSYNLEKKFTKDEILQMYLNEIPYGSNAYGVESAANTYFGKNVQDLTLAESTILAALPQAPSYYSPYGSYLDDLIGRQQYILDLMAENGYITEQQASEARDEKLDFKQRIENINAPHFVFYIKELLTEKYGERMVEQGGLKVYTTLDSYKQGVAEEVVSEWATKNERYNASNAALVSIDTKSGEILAMVGSRDFFNEEIDGQVNVAIRDRQPGSSFKPVVYATAFEKGYTPETMLFDLKTDFGNYSPSNYDLTEHGPVSMKQALAGSLNIPAVKTLYLAGVDNVLNTAHAMGYSTLNDRERYGLSLVLGGGEVKLLEHTAAFAVFAREGIRYPTTAILKVEDNDGKILEEYKESKGQEVLDQKIAQQINSVLTDNNARAFVFGSQNYLTLSDRPVAAKTGTTDDFRDAWTLGYTPSIATGVWVGNNDNSEMSRGAAGAVVAAPIWHEYMRRVLTGTPVELFHSPPSEDIEKPILQGRIDTTVTKKVDLYSEKVIPNSCLDSYPEKYIKDKEFKETHNILYFIDHNDPRGPAPTNPEKDPQYQKWEAPVRRWAEAHGYTYNFEYESCDKRTLGSQPEVSITNPKQNSTLNENAFNIATTVSAGQAHYLTKVEYYIDTTLIESVTSSPFQTTYQPTNLTNGDHKLTVRAYDEISNFSEDSVNFNYQSKQGSTIYFTNPGQSSSVSVDEFPINLKAYAYDPAGIDRIDFYFFDANLSSPPSILINSVESPTSNLINSFWTEAPATGEYKLYVTVTNRNQKETGSDRLSLTVN